MLYRSTIASRYIFQPINFVSKGKQV